jgi:hypothetical protein
MPKYFDTKNDLMFKKVFGKHKNSYISLLKFKNDEQIVRNTFCANFTGGRLDDKRNRMFIRTKFAKFLFFFAHSPCCILFYHR